MNDDRPCILIAEDQNLVTGGLATTVASLGYQIVGPVPNGQTALDALVEQRPALVLLNAATPAASSLETSSRAWSEHQTPSILITEQAADQHIDHVCRASILACLLNPVSIDQLRLSIPIALARAEAERAHRARIEQLQRTIADRRTIEQAKWMLVAAHGYTEPQAHAALQKQARATRQRVLDVAQAVIEGELQLPRDPSLEHISPVV